MPPSPLGIDRRPLTHRLALASLVLLLFASPIHAESGGRWTFFPILSYSPETSFAGGAGAIYGFALDPAPVPGSSLALDLMASIEAQIVFRARTELQRADWLLRAALLAERFPTRYFPDGAHPGDAGERFDQADGELELDIAAKVSPRLALGGRCAVMVADVLDTEAGGLLETTRPLGIEGTWLAAGCGPLVAWDSRDDTRSTHCGAFVELSSVYAAGVAGVGFDALHTRLDLRAFGSLGSHVFGAQLLVEAALGDEPFQMLPRLGGSSRLRGWYDGHLRGAGALLLQGEWRFPLVWKLRAVVFSAMGEVFDELAAVSADALRFGAGAGLRLDLDPAAGAILRLDFAWGSGLGVYFEIGEAF